MRRRCHGVSNGLLHALCCTLMAGALKFVHAYASNQKHFAHPPRLSSSSSFSIFLSHKENDRSRPIYRACFYLTLFSLRMMESATRPAGEVETKTCRRQVLHLQQS